MAPSTRENQPTTTSKEEAAPHIEHIADSDDAPDVKFKLDFKLIMASLSLLLCYESAALDVVLVGPILKYINEDLGPRAYYPWIAIAWTITNAVLILIAGRLMDIWGRRWILLFGNLFGVIGAIVSCTAKSVGIVIVGMTLSGFAAGIQQQSNACLAELYPRRLRPMTSGITSGALLVSMFSSPIAYTFVQRLNWRWSFYVSIMSSGVALVGCFFFYNPPTFQQKHREDGLTMKQELMRFDWIGLVLFIGSMLSLLLGLSWGGVTHPWKSAATIVPIIVGFLGLVCFGIFDSSRFVKEPLVPPILAKDVRGFVMVVVTVFVAGMLLYALISYWPLQVSSMYATNLSTIGWIGITSYGGNVVGSLVVAFSLAKIGHARIVLVISVFLMTVFIASMAAMTVDSKGAAITLCLLGSLAVGSVSATSTSMIVVRVDDRFIGIAVGIATCLRLVGGAVATAIYSSILTNKLKDKIPANVAAAVLPLGLPQSELPGLLEAIATGSPTAILKVPGITSEIIAAAAHAVRASYAEGFKVIYLVSMVFGVCALTAAFFTKNLDDKMNDELSVELNPNKIHVTTKGHTAVHTPDDEEKSG